MGMPVSATDAVILESLSQALRGAAFAVPSALGVQEGGFTVLGSLFGIPPETALALSFVKRVPDLAIGLPGLLAWHWLEMRRMLMIPAAALCSGLGDSPVLSQANGASNRRAAGGTCTRRSVDRNG
jgi:hypothetical protein